MADDPNTEAAKAVRRVTDQDEPLPPDVEAAWEAWIAGIQQVDERARTLLRAAFEAGIEAAQVGTAAELGRRGGVKGGRARADSLSPERRSEIAKNAAAKRWSGEDQSNSGASSG